MRKESNPYDSMFQIHPNPQHHSSVWSRNHLTSVDMSVFAYLLAKNMGKMNHLFEAAAEDDCNACTFGNGCINLPGLILVLFLSGVEFSSVVANNLLS